MSTLNSVVNARACHLQTANAEEEVLLVCGSFYIMEDVRKYFFREHNGGQDPSAVN